VGIDPVGTIGRPETVLIDSIGLKSGILDRRSEYIAVKLVVLALVKRHWMTKQVSSIETVFLSAYEKSSMLYPK
jgi:hypothetical protein